MKIMQASPCERLFRNASLLLMLFVLTSTCSLAQGLGRIVGLVTDKDSAAIPGARVKATQVTTNTQTETVTNSDGGFVFPSLPPATYKI
ncbi:carboxypeptidase-like regulatory domain-containing protein, partial [Terriglobus sp. YAF25]|uniref:carboxypeptidase-like regulatory domain-containing protein n=1 Tax=Terriglobus sp. YAF25 TaxID=3233080 RepID=UPI003F9C8D9E